ncbi:uncharacterized protein LOC117769297 [Hippoglossus hippoglossus]|uniref:uncharacterized protein LOC117769297 n=1 Tax=Hippoglossus hippoglossus TaxID=8267 RepID=UPI00148C6740|nr:uncharacterized protein LOC117769297 [Hippoglossus hippoglossus]XP_035017617.1 uncharacterized protein LOC118112429 [Hippoglossus stenolepis]
MTFNLNFLPIYRSHQLLQSLWEISSCCWPGSVTQGGPSASRGWLRRFLLLKLVTVLLFPHGAGVHLLLGCMLSLRALLLLRSPNISTKPSNVFLGQLALCDGLVLLQWALWLGATLACWMGEGEMGLMKTKESVWWREAVSVLCQQLLDAHHLASLLLLGLLGLEATLVSHWPQQTRNLRTSHWAQLSCGLVWVLVLLELMMSLPYEFLQFFNLHIYSSTRQDSQNAHVGLMPPSSLPAFSPLLRRTLWLINLWLHYAFFCSKPQRRKSSFH